MFFAAIFMGKHPLKSAKTRWSPGRPNMPAMFHRRLSQLQVVEQLFGLGSFGREAWFNVVKGGMFTIPKWLVD